MVNQLTNTEETRKEDDQVWFILSSLRPDYQQCQVSTKCKCKGVVPRGRHRQDKGEGFKRAGRCESAEHRQESAICNVRVDVHVDTIRRMCSRTAGREITFEAW